MNRSYLPSAIVCAVLFLGLYVTRAQSTDCRGPAPLEDPTPAANALPAGALPAGALPAGALAAGALAAGEAYGEPKPSGDQSYGGTVPAEPISDAEAEQLIKDQLLTPWSYSLIPRHRLFSRAAPRPPTVESQLELSLLPAESGAIVGAARLKDGDQPPLPLVLDRHSRQLLVFADGSWQPADRWLKDRWVKVKTLEQRRSR